MQTTMGILGGDTIILKIRLFSAKICWKQSLNCEVSLGPLFILGSKYWRIMSNQYPEIKGDPNKLEFNQYRLNRYNRYWYRWFRFGINMEWVNVGIYKGEWNQKYPKVTRNGNFYPIYWYHYGLSITIPISNIGTIIGLINLYWYPYRYDKW